MNAKEKIYTKRAEFVGFYLFLSLVILMLYKQNDYYVKNS